MGNCIYGRPPINRGRLPSLPMEDIYQPGSIRRGSRDTVRSRRQNGTEQKVVIALYSYEARDENELSFEKGDKMIIIDDREPDWWIAKRMVNGHQGLIPMNFVVRNAIETEE